MPRAGSGTWARTTAASASFNKMAQESLEQQKELKKLERAAERTAEPTRIERDAQEEAEAPPRFAWVIPYLIAAAALGGAYAFLEWYPELGPLSVSMSETL